MRIVVYPADKNVLKVKGQIEIVTGLKATVEDEEGSKIEAI